MWSNGYKSYFFLFFYKFFKIHEKSRVELSTHSHFYLSIKTISRSYRTKRAHQNKKNWYFEGLDFLANISTYRTNQLLKFVPLTMFGLLEMMHSLDHDLWPIGIFCIKILKKKNNALYYRSAIKIFLPFSHDPWWIIMSNSKPHPQETWWFEFYKLRYKITVITIQQPFDFFLSISHKTNLRGFGF